MVRHAAAHHALAQLQSAPAAPPPTAVMDTADKRQLAAAVQAIDGATVRHSGMLTKCDPSVRRPAALSTAPPPLAQAGPRLTRRRWLRVGHGTSAGSYFGAGCSSTTSAGPAPRCASAWTGAGAWRPSSRAWSTAQTAARSRPRTRAPKATSSTSPRPPPLSPVRPRSARSLPPPYSGQQQMRIQQLDQRRAC